ncbi:hypothetical protein ACG83_10820 [Frankia sp. R43]|uniref:hypothetical protein n=1 Tax=Frankia sp. R43 TaxID=269536 RepID=UPI0006C9FE31|nr:hypothetical protein [Frankia sp. R43]KPM55759.1 hypothetical protein ACG83_10820 [Frankia sp. R43]
MRAGELVAYAMSGGLGTSPLLFALTTGGGDGVGVGTVTQLGVTGALAAGLVTFARTVYAREVRRADETAAELRTLNTKVMEEYARTLAEANRALSDAAATLARRSP